MIIVADTSPLNYLVLLGQQDLLLTMYGSLIVPRAVLIEMQHAAAPSVVQAWSANPPSWVSIRSAKQIDTTLPDALGAGEREAISLALELHADVLLIDEWAGRKEAEARGIPAAGTLAVLLNAAVRGDVDLLSSIEALKKSRIPSLS